MISVVVNDANASIADLRMPAKLFFIEKFTFLQKPARGANVCRQNHLIDSSIMPLDLLHIFNFLTRVKIVIVTIWICY